jgi:hypothetical protein
MQPVTGDVIILYQLAWHRNAASVTMATVSLASQSPIDRSVLGQIERPKALELSSGYTVFVARQSVQQAF